MVVKNITMLKRLKLLKKRFLSFFEVKVVTIPNEYSLKELVTMRDEILAEIKRNNDLLQYKSGTMQISEVFDLITILDKLQQDLITVKKTLLESNVKIGNNTLILQLEKEQKKYDNYKRYFKTLKVNVSDPTQRIKILKTIKYDQIVNKLTKSITKIKSELTKNNEKYKIQVDLLLNHYGFLQTTN